MSSDTRFFAAYPDTYESVRRSLDAAWGHPNAIALSCYRPVEVALRDASGRALLGVRSQFCDYAAVSALLPSLLASGAVQEITREQYDDAIPKTGP